MGGREQLLAMARQATTPSSDRAFSLPAFRPNSDSAFPSSPPPGAVVTPRPVPMPPQQPWATGGPSTFPTINRSPLVQRPPVSPPLPGPTDQTGTQQLAA